MLSLKFKLSGYRSSQQGFTLMEVLLAMTLLGILMVLLFASLSTSARSWNKGEAKIAQVNDKALTYGFFKRHLTSARPLWVDVNDGDKQFGFQGDAHNIQFVSQLPLSAGYKDLHWFMVEFNQDEAPGRLMVTLQPLDAEPGNALKPEILLDNIERFTLQYFDPEQKAWRESWRDQENLPALVKINIELADQSDWPAMVFALKLHTADNEQMPDLEL